MLSLAGGSTSSSSATGFMAASLAASATASEAGTAILSTGDPMVPFLTAMSFTTFRALDFIFTAIPAVHRGSPFGTTSCGTSAGPQDARTAAIHGAQEEGQTTGESAFSRAAPTTMSTTTSSTTGRRESTRTRARENTSTK